MTTVNGTKGKNGKSGTHPTAGGTGGDANITSNGQIGADSMTNKANGGDGGNGGNGTGTNGAAGGNGGNASISLAGNIYQPKGKSLTISDTASGGAGGAGGTGALGFNDGDGGNGGNATVNISGNIISTSATLTTIEIDATANGGFGDPGTLTGAPGSQGAASATINGNIIQYNASKPTDVFLSAIAKEAGGTDTPADDGSPLHGAKTATVNGNIISGNVNNVLLQADAEFSNGTANINGNIVNVTQGKVGAVSVESTGQHISITNNKINVGGQELDLTLNELAAAYSTTVSGNAFVGNGKSQFNLDVAANPGPNPLPDAVVINLTTGTFTFDGQSNTLTSFANAGLTGDIQANITGIASGSDLNAGGDTANVFLRGLGGNDTLIGGSANNILFGGGGTNTITGGIGGLNVAYYAGSEWQYTTATLTSVKGGPAGDTSNDTLSNIQRLKFLSPSHVSDVNDDGYSDLVFQNGTNGNLQVRLQGAGLSQTVEPNVTGVGGTWKAIGTGQFTPDTSRDASLLLQQAGTGQLEIISGLAGTPVTTAVTGAPPSLVTPTTFAGWTAVTAGDFNGDAASDVLLQNNTTGAAEIAFMNTAAGQAIGTVDSITAVTSPGLGWNAVSSGDFNGDGNSDILWQNSTTGALDVSLMNGATGTPTAVGNPGTGFTAVGTGDFNGDGMSDILLRNNTTGGAQIWLMNGTTQIGAAINVTGPGAGYTLLGAEDINKDGFSDLLWQNNTTGNVMAQEMTTGGAPLGTLVSLGAPASTFHLVASTGGG